MTTKTYRIENTTSGSLLGYWRADDEAHAMARLVEESGSDQWDTDTVVTETDLSLRLMRDQDSGTCTIILIDGESVVDARPATGYWLERYIAAQSPDEIVEWALGMDGIAMQEAPSAYGVEARPHRIEAVVTHHDGARDGASSAETLGDAHQRIYASREDAEVVAAALQADASEYGLAGVTYRVIEA